MIARHPSPKLRRGEVQNHKRSAWFWAGRGAFAPSHPMLSTRSLNSVYSIKQGIFKLAPSPKVYCIFKHPKALFNQTFAVFNWLTVRCVEGMKAGRLMPSIIVLLINSVDHPLHAFYKIHLLYKLGGSSPDPYHTIGTRRAAKAQVTFVQMQAPRLHHN